MRECLYSFKSKFNCTAIFLFDLVQDTTKSRVLIPLIILFSVFIIVSSIFASGPMRKATPSKLKVLLEPSSSVVIGEIFPRFPILGLRDQFSGIVPNINITVVVTDIRVKFHREKINCDYQYLNEHFWTYEFIRNLGPCSITLNGSITKTNDFGIARFTNLTFAKGPEGMYFYIYQVENFFDSEPKEILVSPSIFDLKMQSSSPKIAKIHSPLNPKPILQIFDRYGKPIQNRIIDAISWPYGDYEQPFPQLFDPDPDKFALFSGARSNISNNNGICTFNNLTIIASTHLSVYIIFVSEGSNIFVPWQNKYPPSNNTILTTI